MEIGKGAGEIPVWARSFLNESDVLRIQEAVAQAEKKTTGEIIPLVVRQSSTTGHLALLLTLFFLVVLLVFEVPQISFFAGLGNPALVSVICFFVAIFSAVLLSKVTWVKRAFLPKQDQAAQVDARAELEFHRSGISATAENTGVLLFVSLMERRAVVLADKGIASKMPPQIWDEVCQLMIQGLKGGETAQGICNGINRSGELLAQEFPNHAENPNEISNQLILKE